MKKNKMKEKERNNRSNEAIRKYAGAIPRREHDNNNNPL